MVAVQMELATLKGMLAGLTQAKGADSASPLDNLEKLTSVIRNITPPPASGGMGAAEVFGIVRDVMSLSKEMAPESSEGTPWGMIIDKAVEPAIGLIGQALAAQKAGQEPTPLPALQAPAAPAALEPGAPMWQAELAKIVPRLLRRAREGKDPDLAAAIFLEDAPGRGGQLSWRPAVRDDDARPGRAAFPGGQEVGVGRNVPEGVQAS
jgi:hypothetical protein